MQVRQHRTREPLALHLLESEQLELGPRLISSNRASWNHYCLGVIQNPSIQGCSWQLHATSVKRQSKCEQVNRYCFVVMSS